MIKRKGRKKQKGGTIGTLYYKKRRFNGGLNFKRQRGGTSIYTNTRGWQGWGNHWFPNQPGGGQRGGNKIKASTNDKKRFKKLWRGIKGIF